MHHSFARLRRRKDGRSGDLVNGRAPGHGPRCRRLISIGVAASTALRAFIASGLAAALWCMDGALAQESYPSKRVKIVVGMPSGTFTDLSARLIGDSLRAELRESF